MSEAEDPGSLEAASLTRSRLLRAIADLEAVIAGGASESSDVIAREVDELRARFDEHQAAIEGARGALADIGSAQPRLLSEIAEIRAEHEAISGHAREIASGVHLLTGDQAELSDRITSLLAEIADHSQHVIAILYDAADTDIPAID